MRCASTKVLFDDNALAQSFWRKPASCADVLKASAKAKVAEQIAKEGRGVGMVHVLGYTDRLGNADYNDRLSRQRAYTVMDYLVKHGVPSGLIVAEGRGSVAPVTTDCDQDDRAALIACLAPDRRVEIIVIGRGHAG